MKIPTIKPEWILYGVGVGVALLALNALIGGRLITSAASTVGRAPADAFYGITEGLLGLPDTRNTKSECEAARAAGNDWEASFICPATTWIKGLFDGK